MSAQVDPMAFGTDEYARVRACATSDLGPGEAVRIETVPPIAVFNIDGEFYATADWCTHENSSLSEEGYVYDGKVECGWHGATFCIKTGAVESPPAREPLACFAVEVVEDSVYVLVPKVGQ